MKKCETFGCKKDGYKTVAIAPGTVVTLCQECYDLVQKERQQYDDKPYDTRELIDDLKSVLRATIHFGDDYEVMAAGRIEMALKNGVIHFDEVKDGV